MCCIDVTEETIAEAVRLKANLIISHHPVIFTGIKSITGRNYTERIILESIRNNIALYAAHTNIDNSYRGVNMKICDKLGLTDCSILAPLSGQLVKIITFVPFEYAETVRNAMFEAGAGQIGNYENCSYNLEGKGTFRGDDNTNPFAGERGKLHFEKEIRIETIAPAYLKDNVIKSMIAAHPYEEVAYDIYPLANEWLTAGAGMIGVLENDISAKDFLTTLKEVFGIPVVRYAGNDTKKIKKVAVCGGAGSFLTRNAIRMGADAFVTGDIKYHQFFDAEDQLLLCDIGHFESEQFTKEIFYDLLTKNLSNFAVHLSKVVTNPIKYYT